VLTSDQRALIIVAVIAAFGVLGAALIAAVGSFVVSLMNRRTAQLNTLLAEKNTSLGEQNAQKISEVRLMVDGRFSEVLQLLGKQAFKDGVQQGHDEEQLKMTKTRDDH
jgi:hypothetical protein